MKTLTLPYPSALHTHVGSVLQRAEEDAGAAEEGADQQPAASAANGTSATEVAAPSAASTLIQVHLIPYLAVTVCLKQRSQSSMQMLTLHSQ